MEKADVSLQQNLVINVGILIKIQTLPADNHMSREAATRAARPLGWGRKVQRLAMSQDVLGCHKEEDGPKGDRTHFESS